MIRLLCASAITLLFLGCFQAPTTPTGTNDNLVVLMIVQKGGGYDTVLIDTVADTLAHHRSAYLQPTTVEAK